MIHIHISIVTTVILVGLFRACGQVLSCYGNIPVIRSSAKSQLINVKSKIRNIYIIYIYAALQSVFEQGKYKRRGGRANV